MIVFGLAFLYFKKKLPDSISKLFDLNIKHKWSEYPKFVDITQEKPQTQGGIYKLRPIGAKK